MHDFPNRAGIPQAKDRDGNPTTVPCVVATFEVPDIAEPIEQYYSLGFKETFGVSPDGKHIIVLRPKADPRKDSAAGQFFDHLAEAGGQELLDRFAEAGDDLSVIDGTEVTTGFVPQLDRDGAETVRTKGDRAGQGIMLVVITQLHGAAAGGKPEEPTVSIDDMAATVLGALVEGARDTDEPVILVKDIMRKVNGAILRGTGLLDADKETVLAYAKLTPPERQALVARAQKVPFLTAHDGELWAYAEPGKIANVDHVFE